MARELQVGDKVRLKPGTEPELEGLEGEVVASPIREGSEALYLRYRGTENGLGPDGWGDTWIFFRQEIEE